MQSSAASACSIVRSRPKNLSGTHATQGLRLLPQLLPAARQLRPRPHPPPRRAAARRSCNLRLLPRLLPHHLLSLTPLWRRILLRLLNLEALTQSCCGGRRGNKEGMRVSCSGRGRMGNKRKGMYKCGWWGAGRVFPPCVTFFPTTIIVVISQG